MLNTVHTVTGATIRAKRIKGGIAGHVLCRKMDPPISRGKLSLIENELSAPTIEELARIDTALDSLIKAKAALQQAAAALGWPRVEAVV